MSTEEIQNLINSEGVSDIIDVRRVHEHLRQQMWNEEYDPAYFEFLRDRATLSGVNSEGFFFKLRDGYYAFETPKAGSATFIFRGEPDDILNYIQEIIRENVPTELVTRNEVRMSGVGTWRLALIRMKAAHPNELEWFVARAIHDEDGTAWHAVVDNYI